jgi:hypothetical protein
MIELINDAGTWVWGSMFSRVDLTVKRTFEQRLQGAEEASHVDVMKEYSRQGAYPVH